MQRITWLQLQKLTTFWLLSCPLGNGQTCPAEIRKLIDALVQADRAVDVKAHHVGIAPGPDNLWREYQGWNYAILTSRTTMLLHKKKISLHWRLEGWWFSKFEEALLYKAAGMKVRRFESLSWWDRVFLKFLGRPEFFGNRTEDTWGL